MAVPLNFTPCRALVIKLGHIGDVLVATPVITALAEAWPKLEITAIVNEGTEAMLRHNPLLKEVMVLRRQHANRAAALVWQLGFLHRVFHGGFDLALELSGGDRGAFLAWLSHARMRVGFRPKEPHLRARAFHVLAPLWDPSQHMVDTFLGQARALGLEPADTRLRFYPGREAQARAAQILAAAGLAPGGYALVHPTSRWMFKTWTPAGVAAVMRHLAGRGLGLVLTSGPEERELAWVDQLRRELGAEAPYLDLAGRLDLYTLGALIAGARLFFGVDSAPMHMAAALGRPVLCIFGPSGEAMWGPWQARSQVVAGECPEHPCGRDGCQGSKISRCLTELEPGVVIAAADRLLREA
ncbi:MAG: putative lipopolysaccharide heptosyltransferase III [Thermodesulfobacteriota bacterium]